MRPGLRGASKIVCLVAPACLVASPLKVARRKPNGRTYAVASAVRKADLVSLLLSVPSVESTVVTG
jgi:hypothetical protein